MIDGCQHGPKHVTGDPCPDCTRERTEEALRLAGIAGQVKQLSADMQAAPTTFIDTPLLQAKRRAFDYPNQANLDLLIAAAKREALSGAIRNVEFDECRRVSVVRLSKLQEMIVDQPASGTLRDRRLLLEWRPSGKCQYDDCDGTRFTHDSGANPRDGAYFCETCGGMQIPTFCPQCDRPMRAHESRLLCDACSTPVIDNKATNAHGDEDDFRIIREVLDRLEATVVAQPAGDFARTVALATIEGIRAHVSHMADIAARSASTAPSESAKH